MTHWPQGAKSGRDK